MPTMYRDRTAARLHGVFSTRGSRELRDRHTPFDLHLCSALEGTRTPNLLIRSQMLYPN